MRFLIGAVLSSVMLVATPLADAAQRYAAPDGGGTDCTQAGPCELTHATGFAGDGDEVIVAPGDYSLATPAMVMAKDVSVHGQAGAPMPRISASLPNQAAIELIGEGSHLSHLDLTVRNETTGVYCGVDTTVEGVLVTALEQFSTGIRQDENCIVRDSVLRTNGTATVALFSGGFLEDVRGVARNLTAIAVGTASVAVLVAYTGILVGTHELDAKNIIASGEASDLRTSPPLSSGIIAISNSNFDSADVGDPEHPISGSSNQTAPPLFVDAVGGDYREAPGSPTIDAGSTEGIGALDLAGNPRALGAAPDIGAFELVPAAAAGALTSLTVSPKSFRPRSSGGAIVSRARNKKRKGGATVRYSLTAASQVGFAIERALPGRRTGGRCVKQTAATRGKKRCTRFKALRGAFSHQGVANQNSFRFSGRVGGRALKPGRYRLVGSAGTSKLRAGFTIKR